jgi:hypothetical protein
MNRETFLIGSNNINNVYEFLLGLYCDKMNHHDGVVIDFFSKVMIFRVNSSNETELIL